MCDASRDSVPLVVAHNSATALHLSTTFDLRMGSGRLSATIEDGLSGEVGEIACNFSQFQILIKKVTDRKEDHASPRCVQNGLYYLHNHSFIQSMTVP